MDFKDEKKPQVTLDDVEHNAAVEYVAAIIQHAWRAADRTRAFCSIINQQKPKAPASYPKIDLTQKLELSQIDLKMIELSGALEIRDWASSGVLENLKKIDPSSVEELFDSLHKAKRAKISNGHLGEEVMDVWLRNFVWQAPSTYNVEILSVGSPEFTDHALEAIAQILWDHRKPTRQSHLEKQKATK